MALPPTTPQGLIRDSESINEWANSEDKTLLNRAGETRRTLVGIESDAQASIEGIETDGANAIQALRVTTAFDFSTGGTVTAGNQAILWRQSSGGDGSHYRWDGEMPKEVPANSTPDTTGGVGEGSWVDVGQAALRSELNSGSALIDGETATRALRLNKRQELQLPSEFSDFPIDPKITFRGSKWMSGFDPRSLIPARENTFYVDPVLGSDDNSGLDFNNAFRTVHHAISQLGDNRIVVAPGKYYWEDGPQGVDPERGVSIVCEQGIAWFSNESRPRDWILQEATEGQVYGYYYGERDIGDGDVLTDHWGAGTHRAMITPSGHTTVGGRYLPNIGSLTPIRNGDVGIYTGAVVALRLPGNENPNNTNFVIKRVSPNIVFTNNSGSDQVFHLENVKCSFGSPSAYRANTNRPGDIFVNINCEFEEGRSSDTVDMDILGLAVMWNCKANYGFRDGFNYHAVGGHSSVAWVFEYNCEGHWNGRDTGGTNNGSTVHESIKIVRVNCEYSNNQNRNIHDINNSNSFNVAVNSRFGQEIGAASFAFGRDGQNDNTIGWMIDCETDIAVVYNNSTLSIDNNSSIADLLQQGTGVVDDYDL